MRARTQQSGFDAHLVKPVNFAKLSRLMDQHLAAPGTEQASAGDPACPRARGPRHVLRDRPRFLSPETASVRPLCPGPPRCARKVIAALQYHRVFTTIEGIPCPRWQSCAWPHRLASSPRRRSALQEPWASIDEVAAHLEVPRTRSTVDRAPRVAGAEDRQAVEAVAVGGRQVDAGRGSAPLGDAGAEPGRRRRR